jgi:hypothetical protein
VPTRKNPRFWNPWKCLIRLCVLRGLCGQTETFGIDRASHILAEDISQARAIHKAIELVRLRD